MLGLDYDWAWKIKCNYGKGKRRGEHAEINWDYRFDMYTFTGAHNYSKSRYTEQSLNKCKKKTKPVNPKSKKGAEWNWVI